MNLLTDKYLATYLEMLDVDLEQSFQKINEQDWTQESLRFATAVSVMSSSRIEGETLEIDSYLKHKLQQVEYLPDLTRRPNDLYEAYEFARDHRLTGANLLKAHSLTTRHLLPEAYRGVVRAGNMLIMDDRTQRISYEATSGAVVKAEFEQFISEMEALINEPLDTSEVFYYAALIHLVFVKIHPFNDGNGRTARLLEKWFIAEKLGGKAWFIGSERYYYDHLSMYYRNLRVVGLFYDQLDYGKSVPFLLMLAGAVTEGSIQ
jgi:Fic family protein